MPKIPVNLKNPKNGQWVEVEIYGTTRKEDIIRDIFFQVGIKENPSDYTVTLASWCLDLKDLAFSKNTHLTIVKKSEALAPCIRFFRESNPTLDKMYAYAKEQVSANFSSSRVEV